MCPLPICLLAGDPNYGGGYDLCGAFALAAISTLGFIRLAIMVALWDRVHPCSCCTSNVSNIKFFAFVFAFPLFQ